MKLSEGEEIINSKGNKLFLTKAYKDVHFTFGGVWKNVAVYTIYQRKTFLGLFSYWKKYTNDNTLKVFARFEELCKRTK